MRSMSAKPSTGKMRRSIAAASVRRTVMNWVNSGSRSGPPSSTSLSKSAHCLHGRHRNVTNNGRFFCRASTIAPAKSVRHATVMLADAGAFPCGGPSISFQGAVVAPWAPNASAIERRNVFMPRSFSTRQKKATATACRCSGLGVPEKLFMAKKKLSGSLILRTFFRHPNSA
jgi:hypothetical protein